MIYEIALTLTVLTGLGAFVAAPVAAVAGYRERQERRMSRSEQIEIVWGDEDPFASDCAFDGSELLQAKSWLRQQFRSGVASPCPCCGQWVKRYLRSISSTMVKALQFMEAKGRPCTSREILRACKLGGGGDHHKLVHWGLVQQTEDGKGWLCTGRGRQFLAGDLRVPRYIFIFNGKLLGRSDGDMIGVYDCIDASGSLEDGRREAPMAEVKTPEEEVAL